MANMLERDISRLNAREHVNLDGLETDIWRRERHVLAIRAASRLLASWQGLVLVLAVATSAATGVAMATHLASPTSFVAEEGLAPSNLLLGSR
jgi:transposase